jgi:putative flippase GtrA
VDIPLLLVVSGRILRFGLVGTCVTLVYLLASTVANEVFRISPVFAAIVGSVASIGVSYIGHSSFSFRVTTNHRVFLWRYLVIVALLLAIAVGVTWLIANVEKLSPRIATATVALMLPIINLPLQPFLGFLARTYYRVESANHLTKFDTDQDD